MTSKRNTITKIKDTSIYKKKLNHSISVLAATNDKKSESLQVNQGN